MYPMPQQFKVDWVKAVTDAAKMGFEAFNEIKGLLPEGTMKDMKIPGLPEDM